MDQIHMKTKSEFCVLKIKCKITMMKTTKLSGIHNSSRRFFIASKYINNIYFA